MLACRAFLLPKMSVLPKVIQAKGDLQTMRPLVLLSADRDLLHQLKAKFHQLAPGITVVLADEPEAQYAEVAACWYPPTGSLRSLPNLKLVHSIAAGVDHLGTEYNDLNVSVCRVVDPDHMQGMAEYIRWGVLFYHRDFDRVIHQQRDKVWLRHPQRPASKLRIGVMGLGSLGSPIAAELASTGYVVRGWSRAVKHINGVDCYSGKEEFSKFVGELDILINLLPLTDHTAGILCEETFNALAPGAAVINCGRGRHLKADDLISALNSGQLRGALLDVFEREPVPQEDELWTAPGVTITPHMASIATFECIVSQVCQNIQQHCLGLPLFNEIDIELGY